MNKNQINLDIDQTKLQQFDMGCTGSESRNRSKPKMSGDSKSLFIEDQDGLKSGVYVRRPQDFGLDFPRALVPLRFIDYHLEIVNGLVNLTLTQTYFNPSDIFLEVDYSLPICPESSIYKFQVSFNNVKIEGVVKQKEEAKKQFDKAKKEGRQTVIGTIDPGSKDIMNLEIGNIPPFTEFRVVISMLQQMKASLNTFYRIQIPSTISPRYVNRVENGIVKVPEFMKNLGTSGEKPDFDWTFRIQLRTQRKIIFFNSPSHKMTTTKNNMTQVFLTMEKIEKPNKDFIFLYTTENFHLPSCVIGGTDSSTSVMLSFIPKFCSLNVDDALRSQLQNKNYETDISLVKGEYVFLLDRSGSMRGPRIQKAKEALVLFLKSLPENSYFNIISFGSRGQRMFPQSQINESKNIQLAIHQVRKMDANMGGTEIYQPLETILCQKVIDGYLRQIFLLTDGAVSNTQGIISLVRKSTKYCRVHSIGIGNGASYNLIQGCASAGKGSFIMLSDNQSTAQKIIQLLETTLTPVISKVMLKCEKQNQVQSIVPNPKSIPYILKDEIVNFFITFKGPLEQRKVFYFQYEDPITKNLYKNQIQIDRNHVNMPFVNKMAHLKVLKSLENSAKQGITVEDQMYFVKIKDYKDEAIKYSIKNQVLSEYTAFLCAGKELVDNKYKQFKDKGNKIVYQEPKPIKPHSLQNKRRSSSILQFNLPGLMMSPVKCRKSMESQMRQPLEKSNASILKQLFKYEDDIPMSLYQTSMVQKIQINPQHKLLIDEVIEQQEVNGSWNNKILIQKLSRNPKQVAELTNKINENIVITKLVILWLSKNHSENKYSLIMKKAQLWLKKVLSENGLNENSLSLIQAQ